MNSSLFGLYKVYMLTHITSINGCNHFENSNCSMQCYDNIQMLTELKMFLL